MQNYQYKKVRLENVGCVRKMTFLLQLEYVTLVFVKVHGYGENKPLVIILIIVLHRMLLRAQSFIVPKN